MKHLYSRYPLVCSSQTLKGLRAQSFPIQLHTPHIITPPLSNNRKNCDRPSWLGPAPTRSDLTSQAETGWKTKNSQIPAPSAAPSTEFTLSAPEWALGELFSPWTGPPRAQTLPRPCSGGVHYSCLYQISRFPVKKNLSKYTSFFNTLKNI